MSVSGTPSLLCLVAMAGSVEALYASLKALICVVRSNAEAAKEMDMNKGYQVGGGGMLGAGFLGVLWRYLSNCFPGF